MIRNESGARVPLPLLVAPDIFGIVANNPDIDRSRVVWARDRGDNAALRAYRVRKV